MKEHQLDFSEELFGLIRVKYIRCGHVSYRDFMPEDWKIEGEVIDTIQLCPACKYHKEIEKKHEY